MMWCANLQTGNCMLVSEVFGIYKQDEFRSNSWDGVMSNVNVTIHTKTKPGKETGKTK